MNETRQINGDAAVSGNMAVGGDAMVRGDMTIDHGLKVKGWVDIANLNFPAVGIFKTETELTDAVTPKKGYIAGVIEDSDSRIGYRIRLWTANGTSWEASNPARYLDVSVVINMTTSIEGIDAEDFAEWQHTVDETLEGKANLEDMSIQPTTGRATIQLRPGVFVNVITEHQDVSGKADKSDMTISGTNGIFEIQLKQGAGITVYTDEAVRQLLGRTVGDAVKATFNVSSPGRYNLLGESVDEDRHLRLIVVDGIGYTSAQGIELSAGNVTVQYVFADAGIVPDGAFAQFNGDINLTEVYLPSYIQNIGERAFEACVSLRKVVCGALTPPIVDNSFADVDVSTVELEVEKIVRSEYTAAAVWKDFQLIK